MTFASLHPVQEKLSNQKYSFRDLQPNYAAAVTCVIILFILLSFVLFFHIRFLLSDFCYDIQYTRYTLTGYSIHAQQNCASCQLKHAARNSILPFESIIDRVMLLVAGLIQKIPLGRKFAGTMAHA